MLETVENLDQNSFWDPNSIDTLIFNSYVGAACILEYTGDKIEMLRVTKHFIEMLGNTELSIEDALKIDWVAHMDKKDLFLFSAATKQSRQTNETVYCDYEFNNIPGCAKRTVIRVGVRVIAATGKRWLVYCISENITAQREAEENEQRLLTDMQTMMADMPGGFVRMHIENDNRYVPTFCNDGFCKLSGMDFDTLMALYGNDPMEKVHMDDRHIVQEAVAEALRNGESVSSRYRLRCANGDYVWVTVFCRITQDQSGNSYLNLYYTDENAREKEARRREMLMDNIPLGAGIYAFKDGQLSLIYQNKSYWDLVGLYDEKFPDMTPMSAIHPDDVPTIMQKLALSIENHDDVKCDIRLRNLKLGYRHVHLVARVLPDEEGDLMIVATFTPDEQVESKPDESKPDEMG